jgi:hypothetical protein
MEFFNDNIAIALYQLSYMRDTALAVGKGIARLLRLSLQ